MTFAERAASNKDGAGQGVSLLTMAFNAQQVTTCGLFGLGFPELAVIAGVVVVIFGERWLLAASQGREHCQSVPCC